MQLFFTISVAVLLGAQAYDDEDQHKFGNFVAGGFDTTDFATKDRREDASGFDRKSVTLSDGTKYGLGGSNYDPGLTNGHSPCPECTGKGSHYHNKYTWLDNEVPGTIKDTDGTTIKGNSLHKGRGVGGLWGETTITTGTEQAPQQAASWVSTHERNTELMEPERATGAQKATFEEMLNNPSTGWGTSKGTFDLVDEGGHDGRARAWGAYQSTDAAAWLDDWTAANIANKHRDQYDKAGKESGKSYPLNTDAAEGAYRLHHQELSHNGGRYTWKGNAVSKTYTNPAGGTLTRDTFGQQEHGTGSQGMIGEGGNGGTGATGPKDTHGHWSEGLFPELGMDETGRYFNGETWPRTQAAYRYSFKTWGNGNRAGTKVDQIFNTGQQDGPTKPTWNLVGTSGDQHKYKWGSGTTGLWKDKTDGAQTNLGNQRDKFANVANGGDQTVYTPRLSYSWTNKKYNSLKSGYENSFHKFSDNSANPAWDWDTFNHNLAGTDTETPMVWQAPDRDAQTDPAISATKKWKDGEGPPGYALTTAIGDKKGYNTNDKYGKGKLDTHRTWDRNGNRRV